MLWALAQRWYHDRLAPGWRRRSTAEMQATFRDVGLTADFWRLEP
ncbi:MAG TPA: hypothetical protein VFJ96_14105 [Gemmatimonadaceae bacterium]|jgi:hypothetical protein|nr:hypothetical protein [Gemmatimonadaceae bacterium]